MCIVSVSTYHMSLVTAPLPSAPSHAENSVAAPTSLGDSRPGATIFGTQKWSRLFQRMLHDVTVLSFGRLNLCMYIYIYVYTVYR